VVLAAVIFLIFQLFFQSYHITGDSMLNTLNNGERVLVLKTSKTPQRGDVIIFKVPGNQNETYVKRVIGLPGETVQIINGIVYINSSALDEPYVNGTPYGNNATVTVPEGSYFVMGDNRNSSDDSRRFGSIESNSIIGKVLFAIWPIGSWGSGITYRY